MSAPEPKTFLIEDAEIIFRNIAGNENMYNVKGDRNFNVVIPPELVDVLAADGWNVRTLKKAEETDPDRFVVEVKVSFKYKPPLIMLITSKKRTPLDESSVDVLDYSDIKTVDLICNGFEWDVNGKQGTKAYLKSMYVTLEEDELARKYADVLAED